MMREIKFRGKRVDNGEWAKGYLFQDYTGEATGKIGAYGIIGEAYTGDTTFDEVDPATVGQFTGLRDKNGREIWEGNILEYDFEDIGKQKAVIAYNDHYCAFLMEPLDDFQFCEIAEGIVIGNIHDNAELLEVKP